MAGRVVSLRRYSAIKKSRGTVIPLLVRSQVIGRDMGCVGVKVGMPGECWGISELDHVRASHGIGMKSETSVSNLVLLCSTHHRMKTEHGKTWRPRLLEYLATVH